MKLNLDPLIEMIRVAVSAHALPDRPGAYARFLGADKPSTAYGCADAANIYYTIGYFERNPENRAKAIAEIQVFQNPETGLFEDETHHCYHTTAHCLAALELFDAGALYPLTALFEFRDPARLEQLLASLDWTGSPWPQSHRGAGVFAALALTGDAPIAWRNHYFDWLDAHCDPEFGMSLQGAIQAGSAEPARHLYGWFHYLFNYLYAKRAFPYPERLLDTCLKLYNEHQLLEVFGTTLSFMEIDWVFAMNRTSRQTPWRFEEVHDALRNFASRYIPMLEAYYQTNNFNDLHALFGAVTAVAELQLALPGELESTIPLKNVLDRRPFI